MTDLTGQLVMANVCGTESFFMPGIVLEGEERRWGYGYLTYQLANEPSNKLIIGSLAIFFAHQQIEMCIHLN